MNQRIEKDEEGFYNSHQTLLGWMSALFQGWLHSGVWFWMANRQHWSQCYRMILIQGPLCIWKCIAAKTNQTKNILIYNETNCIWRYIIIIIIVIIIIINLFGKEGLSTKKVKKAVNHWCGPTIKKCISKKKML